MANILVFGDSIGQGYYDTEGGWVDRLKRYFLEQEIINKWEQSVNVFNLSISGETSNEIFKRLKKEAKPRMWETHEAIFIFALGINDPILIKGKDKVPLNVFINNLYLIIKYAGNYSRKILFLGPNKVNESKVTPMPWSPTEYWYNKRIDRYRKALEKFCHKNNLAYIKMFNQFNKSNFDELLYDGAHPNTKGHELIFEKVRNFLEEKKYI